MALKAGRLDVRSPRLRFRRLCCTFPQLAELVSSQPTARQHQQVSMQAPPNLPPWETKNNDNPQHAERGAASTEDTPPHTFTLEQGITALSYQHRNVAVALEKRRAETCLQMLCSQLTRRNFTDNAKELTCEQFQINPRCCYTDWRFSRASWWERRELGGLRCTS
jgi:hypothetical protein